jgi:hypothetical protein
MTWLWILLFVLACVVPLTAYIYVIEIREAITEDPTRDDLAGPDRSDDQRIAA